MKIINLNWKKKNEIPKRVFCVVIPFGDENDFRRAIDKIKKTRERVDEIEKKWYCDGLIINKNDYWRLLEKSKSIEILNEIESAYGE